MVLTQPFIDDLLGSRGQSLLLVILNLVSLSSIRVSFFGVWVDVQWGSGMIVGSLLGSNLQQQDERGKQ